MKKYIFVTVLVIGILTLGGYLKVVVYSNDAVEEVSEIDSLVSSEDLSVLVIETNWCGWCDTKLQSETTLRSVKGYKIKAEQLSEEILTQYDLTLPAVYLVGEGKLTKIN